MTGRLIVSVAGLLAGLTLLVQWVDAQAPRRTPVRPVSLVDRLERFRRNLLNKPEPAEKSRSQRHGVAGRGDPGGVARGTRASGGGNRNESARSQQTARPAGRTQRAPTPAAPRPGAGRAPHPAAATPQFGDFQPARRARPRGSVPSTGRPQPTPAGRRQRPTLAGTPRSSKPTTAAREMPASSVFDRSPEPTPAERPPAVTIEDRSPPPSHMPTLARKRPASVSRQPSTASQTPTLAKRHPNTARQQPTLARRRTDVAMRADAPARRPAFVRRPPSGIAGTPAPKSGTGRPVDAGPQPTLARPRTTVNRSATRSAKPVPHVARPLRSRSSRQDIAVRPSTEVAAEARRQVGQPQNDILFTQRVPRVAARVSGPRTTIVGRPSEFRVTIANDGTTAAEGVVVQIKIPTWAELTGTTATVGTSQVSSHTGDIATLTWTLGRLGPGDQQHADLQIIPRRGEALQLAVSCSSTPPVTQAVVQVQQPRLQLVVAGPDDALYGESKTFALTLSNPGTGPAENVVVHVLNLGGSDKIDEVHKVGTLAPGMSRKIDLKMVARQTGTVLVKAQATAMGGLSSEATKEVLVRRPALRVDLTGPDSQYAGTQATYRIHVANPGTATARNVIVSASLPRAATYVASSSGGTYTEEDRKVIWQLGALDPKADRAVDLQCALMAPGKNRLEVFAQASADLTDSTTALTDVIGIADLTLDVKDPAGPVQVGREASYEILIHNRGTKRAEEIDVVTFFSEGVEPVRAEGAEYDMGHGQVVFHTIEALGPGRSLVLTVKAKGTRPGNLVCRTEVLCPSVDIRLASEETTRFYGATGGPVTGAARPLREAPADTPTRLSQRPTLARPR